MSTISKSLAPFLADVTLRTTALLVITAIIVVMSRRASAAFRHQVWNLGLISALCLPFLTVALPAWRIPIMSAARKPAVAVQPRHFAESAALTPFTGNDSRPSLPETRIVHRRTVQAVSPMFVRTSGTITIATEPRLSLAEFGLLAWALGAILVLAQLAQGLASLRRIRHKSVSVTDVRCADLVSESVAALCIERPVSVRRMSVPEWVMVPLQICVQIVRALYWFHPLAWLAVRQLRVESENACDDLVLATGMTAQEYARQLLDVALCARARLPFKR